MFRGFQFGENDRRICPDCETVCPETARVCPGCGRKFRVIYPPALGRGYLFPGAMGGSLAIGWLGAWLRLSPEIVRWLLLLPPATLAIGMFSILRRYGRHNWWEGSSFISRALAVLGILLCLAALVLLLEEMGFWVYWVQMR